jgi:hypothetical protein
MSLKYPFGYMLVKIPAKPRRRNKPHHKSRRTRRTHDQVPPILIVLLFLGLGLFLAVLIGLTPALLIGGL